MSSTTSVHKAPIVTGLHHIQEMRGFLEPAALELLAREANVPLYRIQEVASFFPHFRIKPPRKVTLNICRDLSCRLAGSNRMLEELRGLEGADVEVAGVSCLGRCDR